MLLRHFRLREQPFGVTSDPRFLYSSATHREALSSLVYGIESGLGFVTLIAKPGMGKTTLLFEVLGRVRDRARTVFIFQTIATAKDLVRALLLDLGVSEVRGSLVELQAQLNEVVVSLNASGKRLVVVIDEAQNLNESVLEAVRILSNFETGNRKLVQIILSGQLQLADKLALPELLQLRQRVSIFGVLQPLTPPETTAYINHRLQIAGYDSHEPLFTPAALALIASHSEGIPRNINNVCFNALTLGYVQQCQTIDADVIREAIADLQFPDREHMDASPHAAILSPSSSASSAVSISETSRRSTLSRLLVLAAGFVIVLIFGSARISDPPPSSSEVPADKHSLDTASVAGDALPPPTQPASVVKSNSRLVQVLSGQSLSIVCKEQFGECQSELLHEIERMNSSIPDPNHIESGQMVSIPDSFSKSEVEP